MHKKALVCLSGGVDSTAALLRSYQQFAFVRAVFVKTAAKNPPVQAYESCEKLGVELIVADAKDLFKKEIKDLTEDIYSKGETPNPCALCNAKVKLAVPYSMLQEDEYLVTGHYANYSEGLLRRGIDPSKDQSYFLSLVPRRVLERCYFPLADSIKTEVRNEVLARELPFLTSESQDLCFARSKAGVPGDIVDVSGIVVGRHTGLDAYTTGQRKGLGAHTSRKFVVELDIEQNRLIIGDEENLYSEFCLLNSINWLRKPVDNRFDSLIQIRYRKPAAEADITLLGDGLSALVRFYEPQKAVAPGQVGAIFHNEFVLGGGIIGNYRGDKNAE